MQNSMKSEKCIFKAQTRKIYRSMSTDFLKSLVEEHFQSRAHFWHFLASAILKKVHFRAQRNSPVKFTSQID
jgi:hypothetical protein